MWQIKMVKRGYAWLNRRAIVLATWRNQMINQSMLRNMQKHLTRTLSQSFKIIGDRSARNRTMQIHRNLHGNVLSRSRWDNNCEYRVSYVCVSGRILTLKTLRSYETPILSPSLRYSARKIVLFLYSPRLYCQQINITFIKFYKMLIANCNNCELE